MSLAVAGLLMGFVGSSHCVAMCGGIAAALPSATGAGDRRGLGNVQRSLTYNAGRVCSYAAAGAGVGAFGATFAGIGGANGMLALRGLAALLLVAAGLHVAGRSGLLVHVEAVGGRLWRRIAPLARKARASNAPLAAFAFGAMWGWLPCGLVYTALALAAASGSGTEGALVMAGFGVGTLPATLAIGIFAGRGVGRLRSPAARQLAGALVIVFGVWTFAAAANAWARATPDHPQCHEAVAAGNSAS